jgi:hypothetical protein
VEVASPTLVLEEEGGRLGQKAEWGSWAKSQKKFPFRIKIRFLNLQRLWKFVQGDLGGILI